MIGSMQAGYFALSTRSTASGSQTRFRSLRLSAGDTKLLCPSRAGEFLAD
jgi:hypothetical protein